MKRRSLLLIILIVLLPVGLLTWLGLRVARDEQAMTQQRFRGLIEQRLQDVNRVVGDRFSATERYLQQITAIDDLDIDQLRKVVRQEPQVTQLFVLSSDGTLIYPNPADALNGTELSFLQQAAGMFTGRDLQSAVALAEASRKADDRLTAQAPRGGRGGGAGVIGNRMPEEKLLAANDSVPSRSGRPESDVFVPRSSASSDQRELTERSFPPGRRSGVTADSEQATPQPPAPSVRSGTPPLRTQKIERQSAPEAVVLNQATTREVDENPGQKTAVSSLNDQVEMAAVESQPVREAVDGTVLPGQLVAQPNASQSEGQQSDLPAAGFAGLEGMKDSRVVADSEDTSVLSGSSAIDAVQAPRLPPEGVQQLAADFLPSSGWFVWYWDRGLNLVYWQRRPSGHIVGAALERARWIADLIAVLPETEAFGSDRASGSPLDESFRVIDSSAEVVYEWGSDVRDRVTPFCEVPLASPLASWRIQCFIPQEQLAAGIGRRAFLTATGGLTAFSLTLVALAWLLYRDYSRDMREAGQQVSFVNQVSHELKTPLTNIRLYAELLERDLGQVPEEQSEKPRRRLEVITAEAQRLSRLIGNVLTFARQQRKTLQLQVIDLNPADAIRGIAERFSPSLQEHGLSISVESEACGTLKLDPDFLEQIVGNLISNVEKYAASGGVLRIRCECDASAAVVDVIDQGPGIPSSQRSEVFQPFSRLSNDLRASTGTGIGLSIARDLARLHGGDLVLMEAERGCWFRLTLKSPT